MKFAYTVMTTDGEPSHWVFQDRPGSFCFHSRDEIREELIRRGETSWILAREVEAAIG